MPVNSNHPCYDENFETWQTIRDVLAGEEKLKAAGIRYIPRLEGMEDVDYTAYIKRGYFFNATGRSVEAYLGIIFRKPPVFQLGPKAKVDLSTILGQIANDVDLIGTPIADYAKNVTLEVISVGRCGSLVDWNNGEEKRAYLSLYKAEEILNWRAMRIDGEMRLCLVCLSEVQEEANPEDPFVPTEVNTIRVLKLVPISPGIHQYQVEIWRERQTAKKKKKEWILEETIIPMRRGKPLDRIPFVFHGPRDSSHDVEKSPIEDIVRVNLDHYRLSTDYRHGIHFTALPTAWVSGFDAKTELKIGSTAAWVSDQVGATAGFLEFKGQGLMTFERALDRAERLLAVLGSRVLESHKRVSESAEALSIRQGGEFSIIQSISATISSSIDELLNWVYWWHSTEKSPDDVTTEHAVFTLNIDFETTLISAREILSMVYAWQSSAISFDTLWYALKQGEVLPPGRTMEEERKLIQASPPPIPPAPLPQLGGGGP